MGFELAPQKFRRKAVLSYEQLFLTGILASKLNQQRTSKKSLMFYKKGL